jgi:hypothetical protein
MENKKRDLPSASIESPVKTKKRKVDPKKVEVDHVCLDESEGDYFGGNVNSYGQIPEPIGHSSAVLRGQCACARECDLDCRNFKNFLVCNKDICIFGHVGCLNRDYDEKSGAKKVIKRKSDIDKFGAFAQGEAISGEDEDEDEDLPDEDEDDAFGVDQVVIKSGDFVCVLHGDIIRSSKCMKRSRIQPARGFMLKLSKKMYLDMSNVVSPQRFINHSCTPNCRIVTLVDTIDGDFIPQVIVFAVRKNYWSTMAPLVM